MAATSDQAGLVTPRTRNALMHMRLGLYAMDDATHSLEAAKTPQEKREWREKVLDCQDDLAVCAKDLLRALEQT